jgi:undecaprenyl-diphosphatase
VVLWPLLPGPWRRTVAVGAPLWAVAVGISRVALVVHWPSDVIGGWLLAIAVVTAASSLLGRQSKPGPEHPDELRGGPAERDHQAGREGGVRRDAGLDQAFDGGRLDR